MNLRRKSEMQERHINSLQKQINELKDENEALRSRNQELLNKEVQYHAQLDMIEEIRREYVNSITEIKAIKEHYQQAVYDAQQMKKDFAKRFKPLIKRLKTQV